MNPLRPLIKTDDSSRTPSLGPKKSLRTRTTDTNFDENLSAILDSDYGILIFLSNLSFIKLVCKMLWRIESFDINKELSI